MGFLFFDRLISKEAKQETNILFVVALIGHFHYKLEKTVSQGV